MRRLYLVTTTSPSAVWIFIMATFGLSGIAMLVFEKPFERFSYRYPLWNRGESHSARFYRIMGTIWVLIAAGDGRPRCSDFGPCHQAMNPADNSNLKRLLGFVCIAAVAVACQPSPVSSVTPSPAKSQSLLVVYTKWVPDANASGGAEPGYRPALTGLTSHDMQRASASLDSMGTFWVVNVTFTPHGADLLKRLTRDNMAACPSGADVTIGPAYCVGRHLGIWLDLTQKDIDNWDDPAYAATVSQPYDLKCLAHMTATTACPKLLMDAVTLQAINGANAQIVVATKEDAYALANAITSASR